MGRLSFEAGSGLEREWLEPQARDAAKGQEAALKERTKKLGKPE
jgi:hypothetical protein